MNKPQIKVYMKKNTANLLGLLILFTVVLISCKKKTEIVPTDELTGVWQETPAQAYSRRIHFEAGGKFSAELLEQGGVTQSTINGSYAIKGDSLIVKILQTRLGVLVS